MMETRYSVIVPTLGNHEILWQVLDLLEQQRRPATEVIVVFNGWTKDRAAFEARVGQVHPGIRVVATETPFGIAKANNAGFRASAGTWLAFIHDDVLIREDGWLEKMTAVMERHPDVGMVGGCEAKFTDRAAAPAVFVEAGVRECDWSPTVSVTRRAHLERGLLFDENYLVGLEDKDWALSFRRRGLKVACRPIAHLHVGTRGSYSIFLENRSLLDVYSREGVRERYFLEKNRDILDPTYHRERLKLWGRRDRDWTRVWWMKLYARHYGVRLKRALAGGNRR